MFVRASAVGCVGLIALLAASASAGLWEDPEVAAWVATAESPDTLPEDRSAALTGLRGASRGRPGEQRTREAILALSGILRDEDQVRPDEALELMKAAAAYYPDDPRSADSLRRLGLTQIESGENLSAHFALTSLFRRTDAPEDPELRLRAASNAIVVGDIAAALDWISAADPSAMERETRESFWLLHLKAAGQLRRYAEAERALTELEQLGAISWRQDADGLLAAARTDAALGRIESAVDRYHSFFNVHSRHPERPAALLEHGQLNSRLQRTAVALRSFDWILEEHPDSPQADLARLERIQADGSLSPAGRARAYRDVASELRSPASVAEACEGILETLFAAGQPLEALSTLGWIVEHEPGIASLHARRQLQIGLEPALAMLADQDDVVGLAAAAADVESLDFELPQSVRPLVRSARSRLGLPTAEEQKIRAALVDARAGRWDRVRASLAGDGAPETRAADGGDGLTRIRLLAEAEWRLGDSTAALRRIESTLASQPVSPDARGLLVLRADIRYAAGEAVAACADYFAAASIVRSPWVTHQLSSCDPVTSPTEVAAR